MHIATFLGQRDVTTRARNSGLYNHSNIIIVLLRSKRQLVNFQLPQATIYRNNTNDVNMT